MLTTNWQITTQCANRTSTVVQSKAGKFLQIHPVDINRGLIPLPNDGMKIGRDRACGLVLEDDSVSREHVRIELRETGFHLVDLNSTNGTFLNGKKVSDAILRPGDRVGVGNYIFTVLSSDETEAQYYEAVYEMMTRDGLTGTINKRGFLDILKRETRRCLNTARPLSLVLFDLDHFKRINDEFGHLAGDHILRELTLLVQTSIESHATFARYGGEEFAILIPELKASQAERIANRCREIVAEAKFAFSGIDFQVTISLGVADLTHLNPHSLSPDTDLIDAADEMLYRAKNNGRDCVCVR